MEMPTSGEVTFRGMHYDGEDSFALMVKAADDGCHTAFSEPIRVQSSILKQSGPGSGRFGTPALPGSPGYGAPGTGRPGFAPADVLQMLKPTGPAASAAMKLEATPPASGIEAGKPFTIKVAYKDKDGGLAPGADQKVSAKFVAADGTEVPLSGRTTVSPLDGVATFKDLQLPKGVSLVGGKLLLTAPGLVGSAINVTEDGCEVVATILLIFAHVRIIAPPQHHPDCQPPPCLPSLLFTSLTFLTSSTSSRSRCVFIMPLTPPPISNVCVRRKGVPDTHGS